MNETIEDQLRRVLAESALTEVPDGTPIPPRRQESLQLASTRSSRRWLAPAVVGVAAAVIAVVATLVVIREPATVSPPPSVATRPPQTQTPTTSRQSAVGPEVTSAVTGDLVMVPNVFGLTPAAATAALASRHLQIKVTSVPSTDSDKGLVVSQSPAPARSVEPQSVVTVEVGAGHTYSRIPTDLVGKSYNDAVKELTAQKLGVTRQVVDSELPVDQVVKVVGANPGNSVLDGTPITLQVSNNSLFVAPSLANLTLADAAAILQGLGWTGTSKSFAVGNVQTTDKSLVGRIASSPSQSPAIGQKVKKSTVFTVIVYGDKVIALPTFQAGTTLLTVLEAQLAGLGFSDVSIVIKTPALPPARPHTVISMTPSGAGSLVPFDTPITITAWGNPPVVSQTTTVTK